MEGKLHVHINLGGDMQTNFVDVINLPGIQAKTSFCLPPFKVFEDFSKSCYPLLEILEDTIKIKNALILVDVMN